ncbi:MAG: inositol monophosphatase family protein, partial [Candidatus Saccharimonadales bacterium]
GGRVRPLQIDTKPNDTFVTNVDRAVNKLVIQAVRKAYPSHGVIGEEESFMEDARDVWIVDPIDGTDDYIDGGISNTFGIARRKDGELDVGLVYNPFTQEQYTAISGLGAYLNQERIHVNAATLEMKPIYNYGYWDGAKPDLRVIEDTYGPTSCYGSTLYQLCKLAEGELAFTIFPGNELHDVAAGAIIVQEAGGKVSDIQGQPVNWSDSTVYGLIASNPLVHSSVVQHIATLI